MAEYGREAGLTGMLQGISRAIMLKEQKRTASAAQVEGYRERELIDQKLTKGEQDITQGTYDESLRSLDIAQYVQKQNAKKLGLEVQNAEIANAEKVIGNLNNLAAATKNMTYVKSLGGTDEDMIEATKYATEMVNPDPQVSQKAAGSMAVLVTRLSSNPNWNVNNYSEKIEKFVIESQATFTDESITGYTKTIDKIVHFDPTNEADVVDMTKRINNGEVFADKNPNGSISRITPNASKLLVGRAEVEVAGRKAVYSSSKHLEAKENMYQDTLDILMNAEKPTKFAKLDVRGSIFVNPELLKNRVNAKISVYKKLYNMSDIEIKDIQDITNTLVAQMYDTRNMNVVEAGLYESMRDSNYDKTAGGQSFLKKRSDALKSYGGEGATTTITGITTIKTNLDSQGSALLGE